LNSPSQGQTLITLNMILTFKVLKGSTIKLS